MQNIVTYFVFNLILFHLHSLLSLHNEKNRTRTLHSFAHFINVSTGWSKKRTPLVNFDDNFGKHGPILTIFSLLQQEIYDAQNLSYFSHLTFIMLLHYLAKQTLILVSMLHVLIKLMVHSQTLKK